MKYLIYLTSLAMCGASTASVAAVQKPGSVEGSVSALAAPALTDEELRSEAKANRAFGVRLYQQLAKKPGNVFMSPVSIAAAFGPVTLGARAETYAAVSRTMGFRPLPDLMVKRVAGLLGALDSEKGEEGAKVGIANALWVTERHPAKPDFVAQVQSGFGSAAETLDFNDSPAAAKRINDWAAGETEGKITKLFDDNAFNDATALVVTNAVHFLGDWTQPFNAIHTKPEPFFLADGTRRMVPMMGGEKGIKYFADKQMQMIDLPYKGDALSMVVILPTVRDGVAALEAKLNPAALDDWLHKLDTAQDPDFVEGVFVQMPKLQLDNDHNLTDPLKSMGMGIAFDRNRANFRGMSDEQLFISDALHKTFLRIDEKGTEAAAATAVVMSAERSGPEITVRADHPFLLLIRDKKSGAILFMGRIVEP